MEGEKKTDLMTPGSGITRRITAFKLTALLEIKIRGLLNGSRKPKAI